MKTDELLAEVAKRRQIMLDATDPAMILSTLLEIQIEEAVKQMAAMLAGAADHMAAAAEAHIEAGKGVAEQIISAGGQWVSDQVREAMGQSVGDLRAALDDYANRMEASAQSSRFSGWMCVLAAFIVAGSIVFLALRL